MMALAFLLYGVAAVCFGLAALTIGLYIVGVVLLLPLILTQWDQDLCGWATYTLPFWWIFLYFYFS